MMQRLLAGMCVLGLAMALHPGAAQAIGINEKLKSKKVLGDLVPPTACPPGATDPYECSDVILVRGCSNAAQACQSSADCPAFAACTGPVPSKSKAGGKDCYFQKAKFKVITGKDIQVQLKGVSCKVGSPVPTGLCTQLVSLSTIMNEELDKQNNVVENELCDAGGLAGDVAGSANYTVAQSAVVPCDSKGQCKGVVPTSVAGGDPCPNVDKVNQISRFEVMDGPLTCTVNVLGAANFTACVSPVAKVAGPITDPSCTTGQQDVLAVPGTVVQTKPD